MRVAEALGQVLPRPGACFFNNPVKTGVVEDKGRRLTNFLCAKAPFIFTLTLLFS